MKFNKVVYNFSSPASDEGDLSTGSDTFPKCEKPSEDWHCPWGFTVVDDIAPAFKTILEENYLSTISPFEDTTENRMLWWKRRKNLDHCLDKLLRCTSSVRLHESICSNFDLRIYPAYFASFLCS